MKNLFNNLFSIFTQQDNMSKHTKIMFLCTLLLAVLLEFVFPLWATVLMTTILMLSYEIAFAYIPTKQIKFLFFNFKVFDFDKWQTDLIDNVLDKHNDMNKLDFYNICSGLIFYLIYVLIVWLI